MIKLKDAMKLLKISSDILKIMSYKDTIPNGDFQGCVEAQVMIAYLLGKKSKK